jgi:hypothetical protein
MSKAGNRSEAGYDAPTSDLTFLFAPTILLKLEIKKAIPYNKRPWRPIGL